MAKPPKSGYPKNTATTVLHRIADVKQPIFEASIVSTLNGFTDGLDTEVIRRLLNQGAFSAVDTAIPWQELHERLAEGEVAEEYVRTLSQATDALAAETARLVKGVTGVEPVLTFDATNPNVQRFINEKVGALVTNITENSRASVRQAVMSARQREATVAEVARDVKRAVGLRPDQQKSVEKYAENLRQQGIKGKRLRELVDEFAKKKLAERANMIARTEMMSATNGGHAVGWDQAADMGLFNKEEATVRWVAAAEDGRLCPTCESMNDIPRPYTGTWTVRMLDHKGRYTGRTKQVKMPNETHPNCRCTFVLDLESQERVDV
jgi:hypothetical protein